MTVEDLKLALLAKQADAPKNNEDETNRGVANVYDPPENRKPRTLDSRWGDHPAVDQDGHAAVFGTAALAAVEDGRGKMVERLFSSPATMAPVEQALMRANFAGFNEAIHHSPLMQRGHTPLQKEKRASTADETLTDQVLRVAGRR